MKDLYLYNCKAIFDFRQMLFFMICQVLWGLSLRAIQFTDRGGIASQNLGVFCWLLFFLELLFTQNPQFNCAVANIYCNHQPPASTHQVNYKLTCYHDYEGNEGNEADQD